MNNCLTLFFITLITFFLSIQKVNAQGKMQLHNGKIFTEVKNIQKRFSDSTGRYDYKKDPGLYSEKYRVFYTEKLKSLKNLYQDIYDKDVIIGKIDKSILFKTSNEIQAESTVSPPENTPQNQIKSKSVDVTQIENYKQLEDLKKQVTANFPVYLVDEIGEGTYRCKLTFIIDVDGKFKNVQYSGTSGTEFNIISALFLYAIGGLEKPLFYDKKAIVQQFSQPIVLKFE
ncbi:hypothetical protein [Chryseobacterium vrystaatense]|uniref:TonB C-terminal domain-containing protein n=1 Tax=Chryseobacterium vrystaatense TaxID=307480 RepID=A0ABR4UHE8_9FLAO|nr:hypothetical protein [Chryseobacterium vrystaatense]KFF24031.1 hypothetical protein IW16_21900 [Chryseobacterium vrystaatense]